MRIVLSNHIWHDRLELSCKTKRTSTTPFYFGGTCKQIQSNTIKRRRMKSFNLDDSLYKYLNRVNFAEQLRHTLCMESTLAVSIKNGLSVTEKHDRIR